MSLIQEALKRQQMEQEGNLPPYPAPATNPPPAVEPQSADQAPTAKPMLSRVSESAPAAPEPEIRRVASSAINGGDKGHRHSMLPALISVLLTLTMLVGAVVWAFMYGLELAGIHIPWLPRKPVETPEPPSSVVVGEASPVMPETSVSVPVAHIPAAAAPVAVPVAAVAVPPESAAAEPEPAAAAIEPVAIAAEAAIPGAPPAPPKTTLIGKVKAVVAETAAIGRTGGVPEDAPKTGQAPSASGTAIPDKPVMAAAPEPLVWPEITITGIVGNDQKGAAFINGKVIGVNETIQDVRVVAIRQQGALLEFKGEQRLVKIGQPVNRADR